MRCSDAEVRLVLVATLLVVALPVSLLLGQPLVALALLAGLGVAGRRLADGLAVPGSWAAFERELDELGVVVAEPPAAPAAAVPPPVRRSGTWRAPR